VKIAANALNPTARRVGRVDADPLTMEVLYELS